MRTLIDVSRNISSNSVVYPGDAPLRMERLCSIEPGCPCNITELGWTTHFLTHVDPPLHFVEGGSSLDRVALDRFVSDAVVVEVDGDQVAENDVPAGALNGLSILFRTRNSSIADDAPFDQSHVFITKAAAEAAVARGANLIGIDYLSVDRFGDEEYPAHRTLLGGNVIILEGLNLSSVKAGKYTLIALPLKIVGGDGSPVRAILL